MRVSISVFEAPKKTAELVPRMFQLTQRSPREDMGCAINPEYKDELSGLCSPAKGDPPGRGTFGLRWCPSPAPALRRGIKFTNASRLCSSANPQIGVPFSLEFG